MDKIYENQLKLNRRKINESGPWKRKSISDVTIPSGEQIDFPKTTVTPSKKTKKEVEEPSVEDYVKSDLAWDVASLADPTGTVDLANAVRYATKGDWVGAGLSTLGAIPVVGNLATIGKMGKTAISLAKTTKPVTALAKIEKPTVAVARRIYPKADTVTEIKPLVKTATSSIAGKPIVKAAGKTAIAAAAGSVVGSALTNAVKNIKPKKYDEDEDEDSKKNKITLEPIPIPQLDIHKVSIGDPGPASAYAKSELSRRSGAENLPPGYHPYFTGPVNVELNRRRSYFSQTHGLPESIQHENNIKNKIKTSVNKYLKSKEGFELNKHLQSIKNNIDLY